MAFTTESLGNLYFNHRGEYNANTAYIKEDVVDYNNASFFAIKDAPAGNTPYRHEKANHVVTVGSGNVLLNGSNSGVTLQRGQTHIIDQSDSTNDNYPLSFIEDNGTLTNNHINEDQEYLNGVRYFLDGVSVSKVTYRNLDKFNGSTKRQIEIRLEPNAPNSLLFASTNNTITGLNPITFTIQGEIFWQVVRDAFRYTMEESVSIGDYFELSNGTQYYVNDVVVVDVPLDTGLGGSLYDVHETSRTSKATYICVKDTVTDGTLSTMPWYNNSNWMLLSSELSFDDSVLTTNGTTKRYELSVDTGNYVINGIPNNNLYFGVGDVVIFTFDEQYGSAGHPLALGTTADDDTTALGSADGVIYYLDGTFYNDFASFETAFTTAGSNYTNAYLKYTVPSNAPTTLYYFCGVHAGMGGTITVSQYSSVQSQLGSFTGNHLEAIWFPNEGIIGDNNKYYQKPGQCSRRTCVNSPQFINGAGNLTSWGSDSGGQNAVTRDGMQGGITLKFDFYDWWRSTDNGGTGVHSTPDGKIPKVIQAEEGYQSGMVLMNSGEVYHWGYSGHGQHGNASTTNQSFPVHVGGSISNVYAAANAADHTFRDVRIVRIAISNKQEEDSTHSCYALDDNGDLWSWGYNGYGQLGLGDTSNRSQPVKIDKATYFNGNDIVAFWTAGAGYAHIHAIDSQGNLYAWGYNNYGQLGLGDTTQRTTPVQITNPIFDNANHGQIVKVQQQSAGSYGSTAILTNKGKIFVTGYMGDNGIALQGNTSQQNSFVQHQSGPGSPNGAVAETAQNMWMGGNGRYSNIWMTDGNGYLWCAGVNPNYNLGIGNASSPQLIATQPQWDINGQRSYCKDIKAVTTMTHESLNYHNTYIVTNGGFAFVAGRNSYQESSVGEQSTYSNTWYNNPNNIEDDAAGYFVMPRLPNDMQGQLDFVSPHGYGDGGSMYYNAMWLTKHKRVALSGYPGSYQVGHIGIVQSHYTSCQADYPMLW